VDRCFSEIRERISVHTHTHTHTHKHSWDAGVLDVAQHFNRWPGCYAISHHSNMLFFPLSLCLSLPVSSAKRRKMADKILPQRVRLHIFTFVVLFLLCVCVCVCVFLSFVRRAEQSSSAFDVGGFLEGAEGQTIVYYFQMRRERIRVVIRRFSRFFRVSLCFLVGGILI